MTVRKLLTVFLVIAMTFYGVFVPNNGNTVSAASSTPTVIDIQSGADYTLVLMSDETVWGWGDNSLGQLTGTGNKVLPTKIAGLTNVKSIAVGDRSSFAVKTDGTLWAWGKNDYGQLGDGTNVSKSSPVQITTLSNVSMVLHH